MLTVPAAPPGRAHQRRTSPQATPLRAFGVKDRHPMPPVLHHVPPSFPQGRFQERTVSSWPMAGFPSHGAGRCASGFPLAGILRPFPRPSACDNPWLCPDQPNESFIAENPLAGMTGRRSDRGAVPGYSLARLRRDILRVTANRDRAFRPETPLQTPLRKRAKKHREDLSYLTSNGRPGMTNHNRLPVTGAMAHLPLYLAVTGMFQLARLLAR